MARIESLCVYCGSSEGVDSRHAEAARALGREAARRGIRIVFGGGRVGLMGLLADAALELGGEVVGIIPERLMQREVGHSGITRLEVVDGMHTRKQRMADLSDAFCILPGGFGTLDELFETVTWHQLGYHDKPVFLVNQNGYWDPLITMVEHQVAEGYVRPEHRRSLQVVADVEALFVALDR
jgi:uncharacterized protein (TIGR00730 family)